MAHSTSKGTDGLQGINVPPHYSIFPIMYELPALLSVTPIFRPPLAYPRAILFQLIALPTDSLDYAFC